MRIIESTKVYRVGKAAWPLRKRVATTASETADTTVVIMVVTMSVGPLKGAASGGPREDR